MKKRLFLLVICSSINFVACKKVMPSPNDSIKVTVNKNSEVLEIMQKYRKLLSNDPEPIAIIEFLDKNVTKLSKDYVDNIIGDGLLPAYNKQLKEFNNRLLATKMNIFVNSYEVADLTSGDKIKEPEVKVFISDVMRNKFIINQSEGLVYFDIDYLTIKKNFAKYCSNELADCLTILAVENDIHLTDDASLTITWNDIADRVIQTEDFVGKYPKSRFYKEIKNLHLRYLLAYLIGTDNTPAFSYEDNIIKYDLLKSYDRTLKNYPNTDLARIIKEYRSLLVIYKNKKSEEIIKYANKVAIN